MSRGKREKGEWAHPALLEICRAIGPCVRIRGFHNPNLPCDRSEWMKREQWCENCIASAALREIDGLLGGHLSSGTHSAHG